MYNKKNQFRKNNGACMNYRPPIAMLPMAPVLRRRELMGVSITDISNRKIFLKTKPDLLKTINRKELHHGYFKNI